MIEASKKVGPWRAAIILEVQRRGLDTAKINDPIAVELTFYRPRPKSHTNARGVLKLNAPQFPATIPDLDKLARSTLDALTMSGLITDDARVVELNAAKLFVEDRGEGADICIHTISKSKRGVNQYE